LKLERGSSVDAAPFYVPEIGVNVSQPAKQSHSSLREDKIEGFSKDETSDDISNFYPASKERTKAEKYKRIS